MSASTADFYGGSFFGGFMKGFTIGAFTSLAGQAASAGVYSLFDHTANQLIAGVASGAAGGFASGATNALMTGGNSLKSGLISGGIGGALGGITGGLENMDRGNTFWGGESDKQPLLAHVFLKDKNSTTFWSDAGGNDLNTTIYGEWKNHPRYGRIFNPNGQVDIHETYFDFEGALKITSAVTASAISLSTSSKLTNSSVLYSIYQSDGSLYKYGVSDASLKRFRYVLKYEASPGSYGTYSKLVVPKNQAHILEKYMRSLHYNLLGNII